MTAQSNKRVKWVDPFAYNGEEIGIAYTMSTDLAIAERKRVNERYIKEMGIKDYKTNDAELLTDFVVVHWAYII